MTKLKTIHLSTTISYIAFILKNYLQSFFKLKILIYLGLGLGLGIEVNGDHH